MAIFRNHSDQNKSDRSAEDRRRHREIIQDSIKKNLPDIISQENIIGQSGKKKIQIPIRGIREFQFIYGKNQGSKGVGSGTGDEKVGDKVGEDKEKGKGDGKAGNEEGEEIYSVEVDLDDIIQYMFSDLELPDIDKKKLSDSEDITYKRLGFQKKGIPPRLAKKQSVIEKIKREKGSVRAKEELNQQLEDGKISQEEFEDKKNMINPNGRFPFSENDLKYHRMREKKEKTFNAVIFCLMDVSGSMDEVKKYLAKNFFFLLYQFIKCKYEKVEVIFISHTTTATECIENDFFNRAEGGGTFISSAYTKALEIIEERYNPTHWNIYAFHASDGDNWVEDNLKTIQEISKLCLIANLVGYGEITPPNGWNTSDSTIKKELKEKIKYKNFIAVDIQTKKDVFPALKKFLDKEGDQ